MEYSVRLEDFMINGDNGIPEASMFSYSYVKTPEDKNRPVAFAYNGGPGATSSWLHMGLLGPMVMDMTDYLNIKNQAEYKLKENKDFMLDTVDIVLIDPVGTGYAELFDDELCGKYYSTKGDAEAFAKFICQWLKDFDRKESDVYLIGESYGTIRNVALAEILPDNVHLKGIISIGTSLNVGAKGNLSVEPNVRRLGANAAACWYHHHRGEMSMIEFISGAIDFAYNDYAHALLLGNRIADDKYEDVLDTLQYYCGLPRALLDDNNLRFSESEFASKLCSGEVVSTYDSRMTMPAPRNVASKNQRQRDDVEEPDPDKEAFLNNVGSAVSQCIKKYLSCDLDTPENRKYKGDDPEIGLKWDYDSYDKDTLTLPVELMKKNTALRFMFINGYYDLSSTFDFMIYYLSQYDLPADRVRVKVYEAGHASYLGGDCADRMANDIREFIK